MGYSIGVHARTEKLQQRMRGFLQEHFKDWEALAGYKQGINVSPPTTDSNCCDSSPLFVGFTYTSTFGWDRVWLDTVCQWIALKIGKRRRRFDKDTVDPNVMSEPVPYVTYAGYQSWPVIATSAPDALPKTIWWCATDHLGIRNGPGVLGDYCHVAEMTAGLSIRDGDYKTAMDGLLEDCKTSRLAERLKSGEIDQDQWCVERKAVQVKRFRGLVREALDLMQKELHHLDTLWRDASKVELRKAGKFIGGRFG